MCARTSATVAALSHTPITSTSRRCIRRSRSGSRRVAWSTVSAIWSCEAISGQILCSYELSQGTTRRGVTPAMSSHVAWTDIRAEHVARAGGEEAVEAGKREMLAEVTGHRLAEVRRARGLTQQQVADRMGVTKGRISQIERGKISGHDVLARYATALGGRLHQAIYFDDGDITAIA